ncbi:tyrosine--tRNA ligase, partial [Hoeflea sp.]|uniref:tyrosine--tRNA ligase n=1 Tax=Hoeflea sp. TaxID=1940281 RepID=UPI0025BE0035
IEALRSSFANGSLTAYLGFDATADSLHVGHLQGLMLMRWLQRAGHRPILLIGGATTRIGDPSFRDSSRPMLDAATISANIQGISSTFPRYLTFDGGANDALVVNNAEWLDGLSYLEFLDQVGRHFTVNRLLGLDAIRSRLEHSLSVQEFAYTLLQAHDFTELAKRHGCNLQVGGADQWANIINGIELSRRRGGPALFGLTMPLLATADGRKMGKSAQGAVWLNAERLTPFDFWQFWRNTDDRDVGRFLALFTELPMDEIRRLGALHGAELNEAKVVLANEATRLAHGAEAAEVAARAAGGVFGQANDVDGLPTVLLSQERLAAGVSLAELAVEGGLANSRSAARRLAEGGGLRLDGKPVRQADVTLSAGSTEWRLSAGRKQHIRIVLADRPR